MLDLDDPRIAVAPLAADKRDSLVGRQVDDRIGSDRRRVASDLRERSSCGQLHGGSADADERSNIHDAPLT